MNSTTRIYFAPFQSITGKVFRFIWANHFSGIDEFYTPYFTSINHDSRLSPAKLAELKQVSENNIKIVPQILSKEAEEIVRFASILKNHGFGELNWNLGCPYPQVANKKRGSGLLPYPTMIDEILRHVLPAIDIHFSVKCRLGYHSPDEFNELIAVFNQSGISRLIIHPRIGKQLYKGKPDIETFATILPQLGMPVVYNGDINTLAEFEQLQHLFPNLNSWMIGRGLLANPFLAAQIKGIAIPNNRQKHIQHFVEDLYLAYRKHMNNQLAAIGYMKEYWFYLSQSFNDQHKVLKKIIKTRNFDEYENAVAEIFEESCFAIV